MKKVQDQYQQWVYPKPIDDIAEAITSGYWEIGDPQLYWPIYWPTKRKAPESLNILSAGCGANQAAYLAFTNPTSRVTGIDLSETSLAHQQKLKDKHSLHNLELRQLDIYDVSALENEYDLIVSTGVLHHMPDPVKGLNSLSQVLKEDGVANLMVYGSTLRVGVYMLQQAFRDLGLKQVQEDVDLVKTVVSTLNPAHPLSNYLKIADDLIYDAGIVDTFLHPQDRSYLPAEIYELTRDAGLEFLSWAFPHVYNLDSALPAAHPLRSRIQNLDDSVAANVCDLLTQATGTHRWFACHPSYALKSRIPFDSPRLADCYVALHRNVVIKAPADPASQLPARCERDGLQFELDSYLASMLRLMGEQNIASIGEAVRRLSVDAVNQDAILSQLNVTLKALWKNGHVYIFLPEL